MTDPDPPLTEDEFEYRVTASVVEQFAVDHDAADVLRELVQNEYDAGGSRLVLAFGDDALVIGGNGRPIDGKGWRRLSVMLGTGQIAGASEEIEGKLNGIGSKNFGIRSLFRYGDRIEVASGGRRTILDLDRGTLRSPRSDPDTADQRGVLVRVPYRTASRTLLTAFGSQRESDDLRLLAQRVAPTLIKLARPGGGGLRAIEVSSQRHGARLVWRQQVRSAVCRTAAVTAVRRSARSESEGADLDAHVVGLVQEVEYQRSVRPPSGLKEAAVPEYFRVRGGRVRVAVSVRVRGQQLLASEPGRFFYPIGAPAALTGMGVSVAGPFVMDADRKQVVAPSNSAWNAWLLEQAATLTIDVLAGDLAAAYGRSAYEALCDIGTTSVPEYRDAVREGLGSTACWLTRARSRNRPVLADAASVYLTATDELAALLDDSEVLDPGITSSAAARGLAQVSGVHPFTVSSAVRLRCAGKSPSELRTSLAAGEANLWYIDFPAPLLNEDRQRAFGQALDRHRRELRDAERSDLRDASTTLTAAGTLEAPSRLWAVNPELASVPIPLSERLHPALHESRTLVRLCRPFDTSEWARDVAERAGMGTAEPEERAALYRYLVGPDPKLRARTWSSLNRLPVLRDHRGDWAAPGQIALEPSSDSKALEPVLSFGAREYSRNRLLARRMRFRRRLSARDLVAYAALVERDPSHSAAFAAALQRLRRLLTPAACSQIATIACLVVDGASVAPVETYIRLPLIEASVGLQARYMEGLPRNLLERIGCRSAPQVQDVLTNIGSLRAAECGPEAPLALYDALLDAMRRERIPMTSQSEEPVLWASGRWQAPVDVLVGSRLLRIFRSAVSVITDGRLGDLYTKLGAATVATPAHWRRLAEAWDERVRREPQRPLKADELEALRRAYAALTSIPDGIRRDARWLVDRQGCLHSLDDVAKARLLLDDEPRLSMILERDQRVAFAEMREPQLWTLLRNAGARLLSEEAKLVRVSHGEHVTPPMWFERQQARTLGRLHSPALASAVSTVLSAAGGRGLSASRVGERLVRLERIVPCASVAIEYRVARSTAVVSAECAISGGAIVTLAPKRKNDIVEWVSQCVAEALAQRRADIGLLADRLYRLLECPTAEDMRRYLATRGISWEPPSQLELENDDVSDEDIDDSTAEVIDLIAGGLQTAEPLDDHRRIADEPDDSLVNKNREREPRPPLPPLDTVEPVVGDPPAWTRGDRKRRKSSIASGWQPRTPDEQEADRALGRRGEELVYQQERKRLIKLALDPGYVVWISEQDLGADHDIRSIDAEGRDRWIEVKATTGRDGRFSWSRAEFELALKARARYTLWRVYEAASSTPSLIPYDDPISLLLNEQMGLDISTLTAELPLLPPTDH